MKNENKNEIEIENETDICINCGHVRKDHKNKICMGAKDKNICLCTDFRPLPFIIGIEEDDEVFFQRMWIKITALRMKKDKDYGSSWKTMRGIGLTDTIANKIARIKSFEDNGQLNFESIEDSLMDIVNYCMFRLQKNLDEK